MRISSREQALLSAFRLGFLTIHQLRSKLGDERYTELSPTIRRTP